MAPKLTQMKIPVYYVVIIVLGIGMIMYMYMLGGENVMSLDDIYQVQAIQSQKLNEHRHNSLQNQVRELNQQLEQQQQQMEQLIKQTSKNKSPLGKALSKYNPRTKSNGYTPQELHRVIKNTKHRMEDSQRRKDEIKKKLRQKNMLIWKEKHLPENQPQEENPVADEDMVTEGNEPMTVYRPEINATDEESKADQEHVMENQDIEENTESIVDNPHQLKESTDENTDQQDNIAADYDKIRNKLRGKTVIDTAEETEEQQQENKEDTANEEKNPEELKLKRKASGAQTHIAHKKTKTKNKRDSDQDEISTTPTPIVEESEEMPITPEAQEIHSARKEFLLHAWKCQFQSHFIIQKLHHTFSTPFQCSSKDLKIMAWTLLTNTYQFLNTTQIWHDDNPQHLTFTYHDLTSLRRIIMLLYKHEFIEISKTKYQSILTLIAIKEKTYIKHHRQYYPIFNIHPPRSAGTTICNYFRKAANIQRGMSKDMMKDVRRIKINPEGARNCNLMPDGKQFPWYGKVSQNLSARTCPQQYKHQQASGFTMIARESPLYNNADKEIKHPLLCDKFVYMFAMRSPIERILSWLKADTYFKIKGYGDEDKNKWQEVKPTIPKHFMFIGNFFYTVFNTEIDDIRRSYQLYVDEKHKDKVVQVTYNHYYLRQYSSNAITKWIGYEFDKLELEKTEFIEGLERDYHVVKERDIDFYNAVWYMLQIDYVLPFASYEDDISAVNAIKWNDEGHNMAQDMGLSMGSDFRTIVERDDKMIWNIWSRDMSTHFGMDWKLGLFRINKETEFLGKRKETDKPRLRTSSLVRDLKDQDWETLYEENVWDYKLYALSKFIADVDSEYHVDYLDEID